MCGAGCAVCVKFDYLFIGLNQVTETRKRLVYSFRPPRHQEIAARRAYDSSGRWTLSGPEEQVRAAAQQAAAQRQQGKTVCSVSSAGGARRTHLREYICNRRLLGWCRPVGKLLTYRQTLKQTHIHSFLNCSHWIISPMPLCTLCSFDNSVGLLINCVQCTTATTLIAFCMNVPSVDC